MRLPAALEGLLSLDLSGQARTSPVCLVYLVSSVCLVFWLNETHQINKTNQINQTDKIIVFFVLLDFF